MDFDHAFLRRASPLPRAVRAPPDIAVTIPTVNRPEGSNPVRASAARAVSSPSTAACGTSALAVDCSELSTDEDCSDDELSTDEDCSDDELSTELDSLLDDSTELDSLLDDSTE